MTTLRYKDSGDEWQAISLDQEIPLPVDKGGTGETALEGNPSLLHALFDNAITPNKGHYIPLFTGGWEDGCYASVQTFLLNCVFPVGSIYIAYTNTSPASRFGGNWEQITGRVLRAANDVGTGGSDTHTLTVAQMPEHTHKFRAYAGGTGNSTLAQRGYRGDSTNNDVDNVVLASGSSNAHNNLPAYQNVYVWRRTS